MLCEYFDCLIGYRALVLSLCVVVEHGLGLIFILEKIKKGNFFRCTFLLFSVLLLSHTSRIPLLRTKRYGFSKDLIRESTM